MLQLDSKIVLNEEAVKAPNLCDRFSESDLRKIGDEVHTGYTHDRMSRHKWERRTQAAMDLALQVVKEKTFPWPNAANVMFPLVTIAALQFSARAYPAIIDGPNVVKMREIGPSDPEKSARGDRISTHMSWQCLEEDQAWEEQKDRLLISLPIVGSVFSKSFHNPEKGITLSETVFAQDLVLNYFAKSVESCPRKTHLIPMHRNDVHSRIKRDTFRDISAESWYSNPLVPRQDHNTVARDNRLGLKPPLQPDSQTPFMLLEQHVNMDLDQDGYAEPYIITVEEYSKCPLRIVTGFDRIEDIERTRNGSVISIQALQYFTKYSFIPSPDGGIYDLGFGILLGPLNESVNSLVNQLLDHGTMGVAAGGFLGRGAKMRGGVYTFAPLEWKRVDSTGDDLRKSIFPLPVREPPAVLFNLLSLLVNYIQRISGTTDPMVGEPTGQNTPAETTRSMIAEGMRIYSAIFKRVWRSMKEEFKKRYVLNAIYLPRVKSFGKNFKILREDYLGNPDEVVPAADPNMTSDQMVMQQAMALKQSAMSTPGYDPDAVERRWLRALKVDNIDEVYPGIKKTGVPKSEKIQIAELKLQGEQSKLMQQRQEFIIQMQEEMRVNDANIAKIAAEIQKLKADAQAEEGNQQIGLLDAMLGMMKHRNEMLMKNIDVEIKKLDLEKARVEARAESGDMGGLEGASGDTGSSSRSSQSAAGE